MSIDFAPFSPADAPAVEGMTFPRFRPCLAAADPRMAAIVASEAGRAIALALAFADAATGGAELLSLYVSPSHRRRGTGKRLLIELETVLARRGTLGIGAVWMDGRPEADAFAALVQGLGWSRPQPRMIVYGAELTQLGKARWIDAFASLPAGHRVEPWSRVEPSQVLRLQQAIRFENWVPPDLSPFDFQDRGIDGAPPEPSLSLACIAWDDVVGWNFAHRISHDTVRFSCTFVRPDLQQQLFMLALWREAFVRLADTGYRNVSWAVAVERSAMVNFNDRYMAPYLSRRSRSWFSRRALG